MKPLPYFEQEFYYSIDVPRGNVRELYTALSLWTSLLQAYTPVVIAAVPTPLTTSPLVQLQASSRISEITQRRSNGNLCRPLQMGLG